MTKRGRFVFGVVVTIALLASLILTSASALALPNLPDPGNPGPLLPPPVLATETPVPEEEDEGQDEDGDDGPGEPGATATPTPRATTTTQGTAPTTTRTTPATRKDRRGPCTLWTTSSTNHGGSFPALSTPAGTVSSSSARYLLGSRFPVNYGEGTFMLSAARHCTSVKEYYLTGGVTSTSECPGDGYGPWRAAGTYCVREIAPGFWR